MLEKTITNKILKYMKEKGFLTIKTVGGFYQQPGLSDIIACSPRGLFVAIEVKQIGKKPTALQYKFLADVRGRGGAARWVDSFTDAQKTINAIIEYENNR